MKSDFEIKTPALTTKWLFWEDIPAVSVPLDIQADQRPEAAASVQQILTEGIEKCLLLGCHRAFILFKENDFDVARLALSHFSESQNGFEINVEVVEEQRNAHLYDYKGLAEFADQKSAQKVAILSLAPDREKQAKRLGVYL